MSSISLQRPGLRSNSRRIDRGESQERRRTVMKLIAHLATSAAVVMLIVTTAMLLNQLFRADNWKIEVEGESLVDLPGKIDSVMQGLPDRRFWNTRASALQKQLLQAIPDLLDVHIRRSLSGSLQIDAVARTPVGLWQKDSRVELVDLFGQPYRSIGAKEEVDLPILRVGESDLFAATQLLGTLKASQQNRFLAISELLADHGSWKINFTHGEQWLLSRDQDVTESIRQVGALLDLPRWRRGHWKVDARADSRWFIRPATQEGVI